MKKSQLIHMAMLAVVGSEYGPETKLEILKELGKEKDLAEFVEKCEEEEKNE